MSKKHYIAIAGILRELLNDNGADMFIPLRYVELFADKMADYFREENPKFDRERFLVACGTLGETKKGRTA